MARLDLNSLSAANLRRELGFRNKQYAARLGLDCRESYGNPAVICYLPCEEELTHGNFLPTAYRAILKNESWRKRLGKVHTMARSSLPREDRRWRELDSCNSSDALLMNIFCYPGTFRGGAVLDLLGVEAGSVPEFGVRAKVPRGGDSFDRTEVDMRLGNLLVEAKLTETDFQTADGILVKAIATLLKYLNVAGFQNPTGGFSATNCSAMSWRRTTTWDRSAFCWTPGAPISWNCGLR